jgi:hypothetical protein
MVLLPNLYALPFEIFKKSVFFQINCPYWLYTKKKKPKGKIQKKQKQKENGNHVAAVLKIGEPQPVVQLLALFAYPSFLANKIGNRNPW